MTTIPLRILMGKIGLDGHDRGARVVMMALRDAGMEVIYSGLHKTPEALVKAALEEDVDLVGISILSGAHNTLIPRLMKALKKEKLSYLPVHVGGIIPDADIAKLKKSGVKRVFTPGTPLPEIIEWVKEDASKVSKSKRVKRK